MALVERHTNRQAYVLSNVGFLGFLEVEVKGPAKSTPTFVKVGDGRVVVAPSAVMFWRRPSDRVCTSC